MTSVKKIKVALLALVAALVIAIPTAAFAAEVTINDGAGHEFTAYQVFKGTMEDGTLTNIQWGDNVDSDALITAMKAEAGDNDKSPFYIPEDAPTAANVAAVVAKFASNQYDPDVPSARADIDRLAELIKASLNDAAGTTIGAADNYKKNLADGWYFIEDTTTFNEENPQPKDFTRTRYILDLAVEQNITLKADKPELEKKVMEDDGEEAGEWREVADYEIGQTIPYMLEGSLPNNFDDYKTYYYKFTDKMSSGLTYNGDARVVFVNNGVETDAPAGVFTISPAAKGDGVTLEVEAEELIGVDGVSATTKIRVYYSCVLNDNAVLGSAGNPNDVFLTFSNNPNQAQDGEPETSDTPKEYCIVFTFQMDNTKVDAADNAPLLGAGFKLYKMDGETKKYYTGVRDSETGIMGWTTDVTKAKEFFVEDVDGKALFNIKGLDSRDTYYLTESTVPSGYNQMADYQFVINANTAYDTDEYTPEVVALSEVSITSGSTNTPGTANNGKVNAEHENASGSTLPSTGGIGTTIFTIVGIALIVAAAAIMVVRRRNAAAVQ